MTQKKENNHHKEEKHKAEQQKKYKKRSKIRKLTHEQHKKAYPWAHNASEKYNMKTPLAEKVEYLKHPDIPKLLTSNMKKTMMTAIVLPDEVTEEIDQKIEHIYDGKTAAFHCTICSKIFKHHYYAKHHVKHELGYSDY